MRFHYRLESAVKEAVYSERKERKRLSRPLKVILACVLIAALLPSAVFGASKLYGLITDKEGIFGAALTAPSQSKHYVPEYVKVTVTPPAGFETRPELGDLKYCHVGQEPTDGFSIMPMRIKEGEDCREIIPEVKSIEEKTVSGLPAYFITPTAGYGGFDRAYVYYEEMDVTLLIFYKNVTEDELSAFIGGITVCEGTKDDHTALTETEPSSDEDVTYEFERIQKELPADTVITYQDFTESGEEVTLSSYISSIHTVTNIADLDPEDFTDLYPLDEIADENGDLLTKKTEIIEEGDGINTATKILSSEDAPQTLILADITYTNHSDIDTVLYVDYWQDTLKKNADGSFSPLGIIDKENHIFATEYCDTERIFQSDHMENMTDFFCAPIKANETKTITVGFRCNTDRLDNAYLLLYANSSGITSVDTDKDLSGATEYIFKVQ